MSVTNFFSTAFNSSDRLEFIPLPQIDGSKCVLVLCMLVSSMLRCEAVEPELDRRVIESSYFTQLATPVHWDPSAPLPLDAEQQQQSLCGTGFDVNKFRAANLANNRHFAEAINEWSAVIERLQSSNAGFDRDEAFALIERARLYVHIGSKSEALNDIRQASRITPLSEEYRLRLALLSIDVGENSLAEELLAKDANLVNSHDKPIYQYVWAVAQAKGGKVSTAVTSFMEAARLFAIDGSTSSAQACLDAVHGLKDGSRHRMSKLTLSDLTPPRSNSKATIQMLKAFATRKDIFEKGVLEELTPAVVNQSAEPRQPRSKNAATARTSTEILKPVVESLANNGKRISLWLRPDVCALSCDELMHFLGKPLPGYDEMHCEYRGSKVFKVPAGLLVLVSKEGGFNAIWLAQVYSANTAYPQRRQPIPFLSGVKDPYFRIALARADQNSLGFYSRLVEDTLQKDPTSVEAFTYKAEIAAKQQDLEQALIAINQALKLQSVNSKNASQISEERGNPVLIYKGKILLEQKKFVEALTIFEQAFPKTPEADHLYLRAKAEIGVGQYESARKDLSEAADRFFFWGRITRRDEARKLLAAISGKNDFEKNLAGMNPVVVTPSITFESERNKARAFREQINAESQLKNAELLHSKQKLISSRCKNVLIRMSLGAIKPLKLTDALVDFATTATEMKQLPSARSLLERAIRAYCSYGPITEYDQCTVPLIKQLVVFPEEEIGVHLRAVARHSEKFCDDGNFQGNRDAAFNDLIMQYQEEQQIALLRTMIDIRERQSHSRKISSKIWLNRLGYVESEVLNYSANVLRPHSLSGRERNVINRITPAISEQFDASLKSISEMDRLLHRLNSTPVRNTSLLADWKSFVLELKCEPALKQVLQFTGPLAIANAYLQKSAPKLAADSVHEGIDHALDTDTDCLIDSLASLRSAAERNHDFGLAESAYEKALNRLSSVKTIEPTAMLELKLSLAELLMNHQRVLTDQGKARDYRNRAAKLFDECESNQFDKMLVPESYSKTKMAARRMIAMNYPALQKLDLPHGEIIYRKIGADKELEHYIEIGERGMIGRGSNEITLGHTIDILIDGRTLDQMSFEQLDAGNIVEAEKILVAALRAKPAASTFAMLGECWFLKKEKGGALQACQMAFDLDSHNALAVALKQLLRQEKSADKTNALIIQSALSKNSKENAITRSLCALALNDKLQARQILAKYLKVQPKSFVARQLMRTLS